MFSFNKTVVCLEFSKTSIFCALAQITGRKVDILAIDSMQIESGILEEGIIYDAQHLQQIIKNLITSISHTHSQVDSAWISIPDNQVLIAKFEVEKEKKGIHEEDVHRAIEEKFNYSASKLSLINRPIHELNKKVFFLSNAIRTDNLEPFINLFKPLNIPVESIFPTFQCIFEECRDQFTAPTLLLYPSKKGFKFFLADSNGVYLESVWGHNVIEFNENFDKAIQEVTQYAKQSKEVALSVKRIIIVESNEFDSDQIQSYLQKAGIEWSWVSLNSSETGFNPVSVMALKGLIKASMAKNFSKGFLEPQITHTDTTLPYKIPVKAPSVVTTNKEEPAPSTLKVYDSVAAKTTLVDKNTDERKINYKIFVGSILLAAMLLGLMFYIGAKIANRTAKSGEELKDTAQKSVISHSPSEVTTTPTIMLTSTPSPTPTITPLEKKDVTVQVLNGNNVAGEAAKINGILKSNNFTTKPPGNSAAKNTQSTTVTYKDKGAQKIAEEIVRLIESNYPSAKATYDPNSTEDILVVLGVR